MNLKHWSKAKYRTISILLLAILTIIVAFILVFYTSTEKIIQDDYFTTLRMKNEVLAKLYINQLEDQQSATSSKYAIVDSSGNITDTDHIYIFSLAKFNATQIANELNVPRFFVSDIIQFKQSTYQDESLQFVGSKFDTKKGEIVIISYAENYFNTHVQSQLRKFLIICLAVSIILAMAISYYLSKSLFKPITRITKKVKEISAQSLHLRLEEVENNPELNELIQTFNQMLNRMETSFESQKNFISNASHELRTPLTSIIGFTDVALSKSRTTEEYEDTLNIILKEAEKLEKKTNALLSLAQTGFSGKAQKFEPLRIDELMWECIDTVKTLHPAVKINFDMSLLPSNSSKLLVNGNKQLLLLAFTNIIVNAYKYSDNQVVTVSIAATHLEIITIVKDLGIGIPPEEIPYIYDPFYRCSNTKKYEGYGIGLPLTKNILLMHNGQIIVDSSVNVGTLVEMRLPIILS